MNSPSELLALQQSLLENIVGQYQFNKAQSYPSGLTVYRQNLLYSAKRSLMATYPATAKMLGEEAMAYFAQKLLELHPPHTGVWFDWGGELAEIAQSSELAEDLPFLAEFINLEWQLHLSSGAFAKPFKKDSIILLQNQDLDQLKIELNPGLSLAQSRYPLLDLWRAHQVENEDFIPPAETLADILLEHRQHNSPIEYYAVYQIQHKARVEKIPQDLWLWLDEIQQNKHQNLEELMDSLDQGNFYQNLKHAIEHHWFYQVTKIS